MGVRRYGTQPDSHTAQILSYDQNRCDGMFLIAEVKGVTPKMILAAEEYQDSPGLEADD